MLLWIVCILYFLLTLLTHLSFLPFVLRSETQLSKMRANSAERNRNAIVCFWLYLASPVRVLGLVRCPLVPCTSCILNVWVFALGIFTHWRIPLPYTATLYELCCPWEILAIDAKNPFPGRSNSTYSLLWSVFLACASLLLSEAFVLHVSGQGSGRWELPAVFIHSRVFILTSWVQCALKLLVLLQPCIYCWMSFCRLWGAWMRTVAVSEPILRWVAGKGEWKDTGIGRDKKV